MVQIFAALLFMSALVVSFGVIIYMLMANAERITAALNRDPQPAPSVRVHTHPIRPRAARREFSRGPSRQQLLRAAA
ncbi:hypothetical protein [Sphingobium boeckii]|uniref:Uncharacterized protein n=1 Tax=Sphingobium boeckii TaxID=1082345 RepID=A0A7W9AKU1_9SPHN|nr:hypothetical protein [Sphingobium boeckii]MBB5687331.1 hypothetical protein [Sphingobium boeckii]